MKQQRIKHFKHSARNHEDGGGKIEIFWWTIVGAFYVSPNSTSDQILSPYKKNKQETFDFHIHIELYQFCCGLKEKEKL